MSEIKVRVCPEPNCWTAFSALTLKCPQCGTPYRTPMQRLREENAALRARIAGLESERDSVKTDLLEFRGEFEFIDQRNSLLEAENAALKKENERLTREAINSFQMFTNADARLSALLVRGKELENQRDHLQRLLALAVEEREDLEQGERDE